MDAKWSSDSDSHEGSATLAEHLDSLLVSTREFVVDFLLVLPLSMVFTVLPFGMLVGMVHLLRK